MRGKSFDLLRTQEIDCERYLKISKFHVDKIRARSSRCECLIKKEKNVYQVNKPGIARNSNLLLRNKIT